MIILKSYNFQTMETEDSQISAVIVYNSPEITEQKYPLRECTFKVSFLAILLSVDCIPIFFI